MHGGMKLRPWEIDQLSLAEIVLALDDDLEGSKSKPPAGSTPIGSQAELDALAARLRSLTPRERFEMERAKHHV